MVTAQETIAPKVGYKKKMRKKNRMKNRYGRVSVFHSPYSTVKARD